MTDDAQTFIGSGFRFPMGVDHTGSIAMTRGAEDLERSIRMVLSTAPGERLMRPRFGCRIWEHLYEPINPNTLGAMKQAVRDAVAEFEPRVEVENVVVRPSQAEQGMVDIDITYVIRATNDRRNLVYPFYVIPQEES